MSGWAFDGWPGSLVARGAWPYIAGNARSRELPVLKINDIGPQAYRDAMANFAGAVHVVTTDGPAGKRGATVIATCSVSDTPPTVLVCVNRENPKNDAFLKNGNFALNTLTTVQQPLAEAFSGITGLPPEERFAMARWDTIASGAPTLVGALAVFDCELIDTKDLATHRVMFGKVTGLRIGDTLETPLIYFNRAYRAL
jgi:cob(II)yrinic acid a,c-diamide reductase